MELACAFGLVTEAGGVLLLPDERSFGEKYFKTFGTDRRVPVIAASSHELAAAAIDLIRQGTASGEWFGLISYLRGTR